MEHKNTPPKPCSLSRIIILSKNKETVLIFGTGEAGKYHYKKIKKNSNVIGFLDNDTKKQGLLIFGKKVYSPLDIASLDFDRIIIVSSYYKEIEKQLLEKLGIQPHQISIDHGLSLKTSKIETIKRLVKEFILVQICEKDRSIFKILFIIFSKNKQKKIKKTKWLDLLTKEKIHVFLKEEKSVTYGPHFRAKRQDSAFMNLPEVALYKFESAIIGAASRTVAIEDSIIVERVKTTNQHRYADYRAGHLLYQGEKNCLIMQVPPVIEMNGILINGNDETNYYHWMLEILSQLEFIDQIPEEYNDYPILISVSSKEIPSISKFLDNCSIKRKIVLLKSTELYQVSNLLVITSPNNVVRNLKKNKSYQISDCFMRESSIHYLTSIGQQILKNREYEQSPSKIFLARKGYLRIYNQADVLSLLHRYGFEAVYMEDLSLEKQINFIQNAEHIVGPTGAAWTNLIFASPGTKALCWMAEELGSFSCFSNIAHIKNVDLNYLTYTTGNKKTNDLYHQNYKIALSNIEKWLIDAIRSS